MTFDEYQVGCYAEGPSEVLVSYSELPHIKSEILGVVPSKVPGSSGRSVRDLSGFDLPHLSEAARRRSETPFAKRYPLA